MIDNVVLIVTGTLHERDVQELLEKCHPLGMFDRLAFLISSFLDNFAVFNFALSLFIFVCLDLWFSQYCYLGSCSKHARALQIGAC